ncbi:MAG: hypothetical protein RLZZ546_1413, partial [Bacteroidota bacterium]
DHHSNYKLGFFPSIHSAIILDSLNEFATYSYEDFVNNDISIKLYSKKNIESSNNLRKNFGLCDIKTFGKLLIWRYKNPWFVSEKNKPIVLLMADKVSYNNILEDFEEIH